MAQTPQHLRAFQFSVEVTLEKVNLAITFPCQIQIQWKRGNQKLESNKLPSLLGGIAEMGNEKLKLSTNMYFDEQKKLFLEKKSSLSVLLITAKGNKVAGQCQLELSSYLNQHKNNFDLSLKLEKCPDRNASIKLKLELFLIKEVDIETISQMSTVSKNLNDSLDEKDKLTSTQETNENDQEGQKRTEEKYKKQIEDLQRINQMKVDEINKYIQEFEKMKSDKDSQISLLNNSIQQHQNEQKSIHQKYLDLQRSQGTNSLENDNNLKQIQLLEIENERLQRQIKSNEEKLANKDNQYKQLLSELDEKQKLHQDVVSEDKDLKGRYLQTLDKLQQAEEQIDEQQKKINDLSFQLNQQKLSDNNLGLQIRELQEREIELKQSYSQLEKEYKKALQQIKKNQNNIKAYDEEMNVYKSSIEELNTKIYMMQQQEQVYGQEIAKLRDFNKSSQNEQKQQELQLIQIQSLQKQVDDLQERLIESQKKIKQQEKEASKSSPMIGVVTSNDELNKYKDLVKKHQQNENQLKEQLEAEQNKYKQLKNQADQQQQQMQQIHQIRQQLEEAQKIKDKYHQTQKQYQDQQKLLVQVQDQVVRLKCQIGEIFNAAFEFGGPKLVDKIQIAVGMNG